MLKLVASLFGIGFNSSKCKTMAKLTTARIKLLRNKREVVVKQMRRDVALLLQSGQDATARIRVEHVLREQNVLAANEIIELFCELIVARLSIISKQRECPVDLKEGISSLIFAAPRCSEIPELQKIRSIFEKKYGKDFVSAAMELRPDCGVNRTLIEKLSVRRPTGEVKIKLMKEIAKEYQIEWDATESEKELLKPPEEHIEGPRTFMSASSMPVKRASTEGIEVKSTIKRSANDGEGCDVHFEDSASAAKAAAESAKKAISAAQAAAFLADRDSKKLSTISSNGDDPGSRMNAGDTGYQQKLPDRTSDSAFDCSSYLDNEKNGSNSVCKKTYRRHSYNAPALESDIKFDESDGSECDEEIDKEMTPSGIPPPDRPAPQLPYSRHHYTDPKTETDNSDSYRRYHYTDPKTETDNSASYRRHSLPRIHPKLPDYDALSTRFEALKRPKS
ncbi:hypothetical protein Sjap_009792 [Stephania japonica]|uniref:IST1-like protein n=1 Tax=Stephania japonica TaxID=461633 RepID=A0AAP0J979_9MAGN